MAKNPSVACIADDTEKAQAALQALRKHYPFVDANQQPDVIVALGGDGFMLHSLHHYLNKGIPIYGMNCGTVGFLMNAFRSKGLIDRIEKAKTITLHPLHMVAKTTDGKKYKAYAINEVSLLRETSQAAHIQISVDGHIKVHELVCDGVLVATAAGSTAYNLSVHGPIIPLGSNLLALTAISPFRPRRWRGALLPHKAKVKIKIRDPKKRAVSAVADFNEVRDVASVEISEANDKRIMLLFDPGHSLEERIISEQFIF